MAHVRIAERKGPVLTCSSLRCLASLPTINMTAGCAHDCVYCYTRGYRQYPGDETVVLYRHTARQVARELDRRKTKPPGVYFCPSCDAFQPPEQVLDESYRTMSALLARGVGVRLATKGIVPDRFLDLFVQHRGLVSGQVGLISLDDELLGIIEPGAPSPKQRLATIGDLRDAGAEVSLRADPLIHRATDSPGQLARLFAAARDAGAGAIAVSYLFLRPMILRILRRRLAESGLLDRILASYEHGEALGIRGGSGRGLMLSAEIRRRAFADIRSVAAAHGLPLSICGCKNADLVRSRCGLAGAEPLRKRAQGGIDSRPLLWPTTHATDREAP